MPWRARVGLGLGLGLLLLTPVLLRVVLSGREALAAAEQALAEEKTELAVVHLRHAARWYLPGAPWVARAHTHLKTLAAAQQRDGKLHAALFSLRNLRSAVLATRSFYTPHADLLRETNAQIAALMATQPPAAMDATKSVPELEATYLAELKAQRRARPWAALLASLGFLGCVVALWLGAAGLRRRHVLAFVAASLAFVLGLLAA